MAADSKGTDWGKLLSDLDKENKRLSSSDFYSDMKNSIENLGVTLTKSLKPGLDDMANMLEKMDSMAVGVANSFGQGRENIQQIKIALGDAFASVAELGGGFQDISEIQNAVVSDLNRSVLLSSDVYSKIFAATEVTGQGANNLIPAFKNIGVSAYGVAE